MRKTWLPIIVAVVSLAVLAASYPIESTVAPEWRVRVVDSNGAPVSGVRVREFWKHYGLEFHGGGGGEDRYSDADGYTTFPRRTIKATLLRRIISPVVQVVMYQEHSQFGALARVQVCNRGNCEMVYYESSPTQIVLPKPIKAESQ